MRFHDGSTNRDIRSGGRVAGAILLMLTLPLPALAAKLVEVRVGRHPGYTRVVLQTDSPVGYELTRSKNGNVRVTLAADASPRRLGSKSEVLREVIVESTGDGALARLKLHRPDVEVKELVLKSPPRIVLDLKPGVPQPTLAAQPEAPAEPDPAPAVVAEASPGERDPAPAVAPEAVQPEAPVEPDPAPAVVAEAAPSAGSSGRLGDTAPEPSEPAPNVAAEEAAPDSPAGEAPEAGDWDEGTSTADAEPAEAGDPGEPPPGLADADADADAEREEAAGLPEMPAPPPPVARRESESPRTPPAVVAPSGGALGFLPAPLDDPLVLGGIVGLLVLIAALVAVRRRGAGRAEEDLDSPFATGDPFESAMPEPAAAATASFDVPPPAAEPHEDSDLPVMPGQATDEQGPLFSQSSQFDEGDSLFGGEADEEKEPEDRTFVAPAPATAGDAAPAVPEGDVMRVVEELERRMGQMETRLEEVMDAKERLERQVSAQTEELRVQRAAIARTQRVLRNVSRPEDEATEPAPKV